MNTEVYPVNCSFVEYSINYIQNTMNKEDLYSLLTNDDIWEDFVTEAHFSREEAEEVRVSLMAQEALEDMKDIDPQEQELRERFLKEFPQMKRELEQQIKQLRALADKADKIHKDCTILNVVASSSGILSGILTIAGFGLAPVTAGISLGLTTAGLGLGTASAMTGVATGIMEHTKLAAIEGDAKKLTSTEVNPEEILKGIMSNCARKVVPMGTNIYKGMMNIEKNIRAIKLVSANPRLAARATRFMTSGKISARGARQVQKAFGGTALAMSKGARLAGMATSGIFLLVDVYNLVQQSVELEKGTETASASRLREYASELERKLENLKEIHAILLEENSPGNSLGSRGLN